jgi:hypothetical protein
VVSFTARPLYPQGKSPWYPFDRRLGGPQGRSGHGVEEKNSQPPPGIETRSSDQTNNNLNKRHNCKKKHFRGQMKTDEIENMLPPIQKAVAIYCYGK